MWSDGYRGCCIYAINKIVVDADLSGAVDYVKMEEIDQGINVIDGGSSRNQLEQ